MFSDQDLQETYNRDQIEFFGCNEGIGVDEYTNIYEYYDSNNDENEQPGEKTPNNQTGLPSPVQTTNPINNGNIGPQTIIQGRKRLINSLFCVKVHTYALKIRIYGAGGVFELFTTHSFTNFNCSRFVH